jgi:hypothetical protein
MDEWGEEYIAIALTTKRPLKLGAHRATTALDGSMNT